MKCCGVNGPDDWRKAGRLLPISCCTKYSSQSEEECRRNNSGTSVYSAGCYSKIKDKINANATLLVGVGIGIAFIEVCFFIQLFTPDLFIWHYYILDHWNSISVLVGVNN